MDDIIDNKHITKKIFETIGKLLKTEPILCYKKYLENSFNTNLGTILGWWSLEV